ncbi:CHAT domain-containing protein [Nostoc sp. NMS7]|uniref:CHAT domain-containing protein n=1 Tax=Nostoc sp. NMS7 TaxID=2815391 RepID=UPI0025D964B7|nr:CHAT domain-containing protein [Nostoc sp. NMS7]
MKITRRRYLFCGIVGLIMAVGKPSRLIAQSGNQITQKAELLTERGHELLNQGQYLLALEAWKDATEIYRQLKLDEGVAGNLINQNLALQGLGLYLNACDVLLSALKIDKSNYSPTFYPTRNNSKKALSTVIHRVKPTRVNLLGLLNLGDVLRLMGQLDESEIVLKETLSLTQQVIPNQDISSIFLSLGNTKQSMYERSYIQYKWIEEVIYKKETVAKMQRDALLSLEYYQQVNNLAKAPIGVKLQAQISSLRLLLDFDKWLKTAPEINQRFPATKTHINQQIQPLIDSIIKNSFSFDELPVSQSAYAKLNFADSLSKTSNKQLQSVAIQYVKSALQAAQRINNQLLQSFCWGTLGKLNPEKSQAYFKQALLFAQSIQAWDVAYQWQQQLGDLYSQQGKSQEASGFYEAAISNLTQVRANLLGSNPDTQFFFYEKVEPVYRNYMRLLLADSRSNIKKVIQINEEFKTTELENYLQCGKLDIIPLNEFKNLQTPPTVVHIIDLDNTVEVIVQLSDGSLKHHSVDSNIVKASVDNLLEILQSSRLASINKNLIISPSQALYDLLIVPIKTYLPPSGTLVLTLDTSFQSLPIGLLHDGKDYLLKQYSIAQTLGSRIRPPKFLPKEQLRALIAGLSKISPSFNALNAPEGLKALLKVKEEVEDVKKQTTYSKVLLNEKFTSEALEQQLSTNDFSILHLTTHAQFSSDAQRTMFFTWNKPITVLEFDNLLKLNAQTNKNGIELLVLSACQTAKGNKRSALGIAGVAAQAGARSTVATLWKVDADSTALLMEEFYRNLKSGTPKAEALRQAQLNLMANSKYSHPYFWASFLLVGGWL